MNPLLDKEFLRKLDKHREKEVYAKIISLTFDELPIEEITGRVTSGGSINIDGTSAIRRSCSFSMVAQEMNINDFHWGLNTKFKLFMGLKNNIDKKYPETIWFPQGIYLISSFSTSQSVNNYTISIQGKDKMSLLNGEIGGSIVAKTDFGTIEEIDLETNTTTITSLPIKDIIREGVHEYAHEPWENIIVNDLDDLGIELMQYKGSKPLYLFINENNGEVVNITLNDKMEVFWKTRKDKNWDASKKTLATIAKETGGLNKLNELYPGDDNGYLVKFSENSENIYSVAQIIYGQTAGYRLTDITYAGELVANAGESFTAGVLDKIVKMLGDFEYFYTTDGRFIFQRKKIYINQSWNNIQTNGDEEYVAPLQSEYSYNFENSNLITSFANTPNMAGLKNDFAIWGQRTTAAGAQVPIHLRYALDIKPTKYVSFGLTQDEANEYNSMFGPTKPLQPREPVEYNIEQYDWRELIYRMALDYRKFNHWERFLTKIKQANPEHYPTGYTGYEQYYIDMEGFWKQLYDTELNNYYYQSIDYNSLEGYSIDEIYFKPIRLITPEDEVGPRDAYVFAIDNNGVQYLEQFAKIDDIDPNYYPDTTFYKKGLSEGTYISFSKNKDGKIENYDIANNLYIQLDDGTYKAWLDVMYEKYMKNNQMLRMFADEYVQLKDVGNEYSIYYSNGKFIEYYYTKQIRSNKTEYFEKNAFKYYVYTTDYYETGENKYWHKNIVESPESLNFWIDFMDPMGDIAKYSVPVIGSRPKVVNETTIKAIYHRETPNVVFINKSNIKGWTLTDRKPGYTYIQIPDNMLGLFSISAQGQSAQDKLNECLYNDTFCTESVSMNIIPIYYLEPNTKVYIRDDNSKINGEYSITRLTIPLTYNGMMSVSATKVVERIL